MHQQLLTWKAAAQAVNIAQARLVSESNCLLVSAGCCKSSICLPCAAHGDGCLQEEIAHCAAGVRWLTYLHQQANAPAPDQKGQASTASAEGHQEPNDTSAAAAEPSAANDQQRGTGAVTFQLQPHIMQQTPSKSVERSADESCEWVKHARQYRTVEEWFHALVQTHFKGSLKVCCLCFCMYVEVCQVAVM